MSRTVTANGKSLWVLSGGLSGAAEFSLATGDVVAGESGVSEMLFKRSGILFYLRGLSFSRRISRRLVLQRDVHSLAHLIHGGTGYSACPGRTRFQNIPGEPWILLVFFAACLHRVKHVDQGICRPTLALDAANSSRAATLVHFGNSRSIAENFMQVANRTNVGIAGIGSADTCWIGDHRL